MNHCAEPLSRRRFLGLLGSGAIGAATPRAVRAAAPPASKPNIILCMTDDQGWGDTGYNGHPHLKTPNLDAMAAAGIRFDRFYAAHPGGCNTTVFHTVGTLRGPHPEVA